MHRVLPIVVAVTASCARIESPPVNLATPAAAPIGESRVVMCETPKHWPSDFLEKGVEDLIFQPCDAFVDGFDKTISAVCFDALPAVAKALRAEQHSERDRAVAAWPLVPRQCREHFPHETIDLDTSRPIDELDHDWRSCMPEAEVAAAYSRDLASVPHARVSVGLHLFALGLSQHLTPLGRQYLRKYVVCRALAEAAEQYPDVRATYDTVLVSPKQEGDP